MAQSVEGTFPPPADPLVQRVLAFVGREQGIAWLVGGYVRDRLLGRPNHDLDLIVPEGGIRLARALARALGGGFFPLDSERDVGRAVLADAGGQPLFVDVARWRVPDLAGDLAARDFTVNAIAVELDPPGGEPGAIVDPAGGRTDLNARLIRMVGPAAFRDDPLRMLRAVRQAAELHFEIEPGTAEAIRQDASRLSSVAVERVRDELYRIVTAPSSWQHLRRLAGLGLLPYALPEAADLIGVAQSPPHYLDVFDHTRAALAHLEGILAWLWPAGPYGRPAPVPGDPVEISRDELWNGLAGALSPYAEALRAHLEREVAAGRCLRDLLWWAALAHDWGKPRTGSEAAAGRIHFYQHEAVGARLIEERAHALAFSTHEAAHLQRLVEAHMRPGHLAHDYPPTRRALFRFLRDLGTAAPDCVLLSLADRLATHAASEPASASQDGWQEYLSVATLLIGNYFREGISTGALSGQEPADAGNAAGIVVNPDPVLFLNGHAIMAEFGLAPGPFIGQLLEGLREAQAIGEITTHEQARAWLARQIAEGGPPHPQFDRRDDA